MNDAQIPEVYDVGNSVRVELRFKNALLWRSILPIYGSVAEFCRVNGFQRRNHMVGRLICLTKSPYDKRLGTLTDTAAWLCEVLGWSPGELFPPALYSGVVPTGVLATEITPERLLSTGSDEALALSDHGEGALAVIEGADRNLLTANFKAMFDRLNPRQERVMKMRFFEDKTLQEVADILDLTRERVRQIETEAFRRLRYWMMKDSGFNTTQG